MTASQKPPKPVLGEDAVAAFQIDGQPIRGRILRMGAAMDKVLSARDYPHAVSGVLGEASLVAALVARALKFEGRLLIQCHGTNEGAVSMVIADCTTSGDLRAYARYDGPALEAILEDSPHPTALQLIGPGTFAMTIDQGADMERYQGLAAIEGDSLAASAEHYFRQSEQVPTLMRLAVGQVQTPGEAPSWRGGGIMIQKIAGDAARGDTEEAWDTATALFGTLSDEELLDPKLGSDEVLYRLFHEGGVRLMPMESVQAKCSCSRERLAATLEAFEASERDSMFEDGQIKASCDFCNTDYVFTPKDFEG